MGRYIFLKMWDSNFKQWDKHKNTHLSLLLFSFWVFYKNHASKKPRRKKETRKCKSFVWTIRHIQTITCNTYETESWLQVWTLFSNWCFSINNISHLQRSTFPCYSRQLFQNMDSKTINSLRTIAFCGFGVETVISCGVSVKRHIPVWLTDCSQKSASIWGQSIFDVYCKERETKEEWVPTPLNQSDVWCFKITLTLKQKKSLQHQ